MITGQVDMKHEINLENHLYKQLYKDSSSITIDHNLFKEPKILKGDLVFMHNTEDEYQVIKAVVDKADEDAVELRKLNDPYLVDGHMHLEYGPLSKEYVLEFVKEAYKKGMDEIDILDHTHRFREFEGCYEHLKKYPQQDEWLKQKTKFCSSLDDYYQLIEEVKKEELPLKVKFGLEVCYTRNTEDQLRKILKDVHLDFLTGAVHSFASILYDMSFSEELLSASYDTDRIYTDYYEALIDCIDSGLFDRLAHPDQIKIINDVPSFDLHPIYEKIAVVLNKHDMAAESNTGGHYRYGFKDIGTNEDFIKILKKHNVRFITASDAHKPADAGNYILQAFRKIEEVV